ncbi:AbrB/MazE/SpoVT family DNA-binding domain-containing protein [Synoicihabitans lomoniglobus]|uniref:AbrB/MazE/SpoVT family DNA-binding domain-containing protein n=1 Tax=Synoicihabitans lomoniglobus TaxID=2909285 RepID=A0AAF0CP38_9BACT|nr:AbrB/MazE/SpoVT family DNA-binding domain-containing protein [Opitutaceae bacterium LMO-M01]WED63319.1 AbrB/MazE/SpoVT family DNA-binding domain-containing protein [Opitutaceae bacterium LMO-M01]
MPGKRAKQTVCFTTKGQIVIPAALRKYFQIENGSEAIVEETADGILLRPVTAWSIKRARGVAKKATATGSDFATEWAKQKAEERDLEDAKNARLSSRRSR